MNDLPKKLSPQDLYIENQRLNEENLRLQNELFKDDLTGLFNARFLKVRLENCLAQRFEEDAAPSLIFLDVDHFKEINEEHGHLAAGKVLGQVGCRIASLIREEDVAFRYGGDEFVVLVSGGRAGALAAGERLRAGIAAQPFRADGLQGAAAIYLTVSLGVRVIEPGDQMGEIIEAADRAMYQAKRKSRNTVVSA